MPAEKPPPLTSDPNLEKCPDFGVPQFAELRNIIKNARGEDDDNIVAFLVQQWSAKNAADKERWATQVLVQNREQEQDDEQEEADNKGEEEDQHSVPSEPPDRNSGSDDF